MKQTAMQMTTSPEVRIVCLGDSMALKRSLARGRGVTQCLLAVVLALLSGRS